MSIPDIRKCRWSCYGNACGRETIGSFICEAHGPCASCGAPSTHGCDYTGQFVCGFPLCDQCVGANDKGPSGAWGFLNHIHIRKGDLLPSEKKAKAEREAKELAAEHLALGVGEDLA